MSSASIFGARQSTITHGSDLGGGTNKLKIPKAIQIRYPSGAETIFESEQKDEIVEYLVENIWGFHETEVTKEDLAPGIGVIKCLFTLCLLKPEYAALITTR